MKIQHTAVVALFSLITACAGEPAPSDAAPDPAAEAVDPAVSTFEKGGDFRFALADSAVLADVKASCATEAQAVSDARARADSAASCLQRITDAAAGEGIEITPLGNGRLHYLSYFHEDGKRMAHIDAELSVRSHEPGILELTDVDVKVGPKLPPGALFIEVVDGDTLAMDKQPGGHPRTGSKRLVFHRSAQ